MKHWLLNCSDVSRLVSQSMDERLPLHRRAGIKFHLMMCRYCVRYARQLQLMRQKIYAWSSEPPITPMSEDRKAALREMLSRK